MLLETSGREPEREAIDRTLDAFSELPAFPDVRPAFELLREHSVKVATR